MIVYFFISNLLIFVKLSINLIYLMIYLYFVIVMEVEILLLGLYCGGMISFYGMIEVTLRYF